MRIPTQHLSRQEALLVRELSLSPGRFIPTIQLADAIGQLGSWPASQYRVHATVQKIRRKYGVDVIASLKGRQGSGYSLVLHV